MPLTHRAKGLAQAIVELVVLLCPVEGKLRRVNDPDHVEQVTLQRQVASRQTQQQSGCSSSSYRRQNAGNADGSRTHGAAGTATPIYSYVLESPPGSPPVLEPLQAPLLYWKLLQLESIQLYCSVVGAVASSPSPAPAPPQP